MPSILIDGNRGAGTYYARTAQERSVWISGKSEFEKKVTAQNRFGAVIYLTRWIFHFSVPEMEIHRVR